MIYKNNEMENAWTKESSNTSITQWIIIVAVIVSKNVCEIVIL